MMFRSFTTLACLLLVSPALAQTVDTTPPPYTDEQGEEVFGLGYSPLSPADAGAPLLVGRPNAGIQTDADLAGLNQLEFMSILAAQPSPNASVSNSRLPLLKSVREANSLLRWSAPPKPSELPVQRRTAVKEMTVHYVYVGQGAGAILEFPCGVAVIDTGGEYNSGDNGGQMFIDYLGQFFDARPALHRTIDVLITSHPHKDHQFGLSLMKLGGADGYTIRNIVDNGQTGAEGQLKVQTDRREAARTTGARYSAVESKNQVYATGSTNAVIDPLVCPGIDPKLTAFWGGRNEELSAGAARASRYKTPNNHSVVVRVDYGKASLLFLGDLQHEGAEDMLREYEDNPGVFNVDVFQVAHHGAENGTSDALLKAMSPKIGIISMGDKSSQRPSTAYDHGHPRLSTIALMQDEPNIVSGMRTPTTYWGAHAEETPFQPVSISHAIYGTGWEGTIRLKVKSDGTYRIEKP